MAVETTSCVGPLQIRVWTQIYTDIDSSFL